MIDYKVLFTPEAAGLYNELHPENKKLVKAAIREIKEDPFSGYDLQEELSGFKAYRSNRYWIVYRINETAKAVEMLYVGHRRDIYEQFRRLLHQMG